MKIWRIRELAETSRWAIRFALVFCTVLAAISMLVVIWPMSQRDQPRHAFPRREIDLSALHIEIVDTDQDRAQGLSGRESLPVDAGMLFVFEHRGVYPFWMKEMKFPLDIVWLDGDSVVDVVTLSAPQLAEAMIPRHVPSMLSDRVLEINAGQASALGLAKGVRVHFSADVK